MKQARNSGSKTHVKKLNPISRTEIRRKTRKYLFLGTPCMYLQPKSCLHYRQYLWKFYLFRPSSTKATKVRPENFGFPTKYLYPGYTHNFLSWWDEIIFNKQRVKLLQYSFILQPDILIFCRVWNNLCLSCNMSDNMFSSRNEKKLRNVKYFIKSNSNVNLRDLKT